MVNLYVSLYYNAHNFLVNTIKIHIHSVHKVIILQYELTYINILNKYIDGINVSDKTFKSDIYFACSIY